MNTNQMDAESFVRWALDPARTVEERYTVELLVEECLRHWNIIHKTGHIENWQVQQERVRQRKLNPAYEPRYTEESLRRAAEVFPSRTSWSAPHTYDNRPVRDIKALRFLPKLQTLNLGTTEITDLTPLVDLPELRTLTFGSEICEDFRALAQCTQIKELTLKLTRHWPEVRGLEKLVGLEMLSLTGNLLAFERGLVWPNVRRGTLLCEPLAARNIRELPQLPKCEFLTVGGIERLDGIEAFPHLRNLTVNGSVRTFEPLNSLQHLTCFTCNAAEPLDVAPLTKLPKLLFASFKTQHNFGIDKARPRDFSPLIEAPQLRELKVEGCPPVDTEVAGLNAGFSPWSDLFLRQSPRSLPPLRMIVAPAQKVNRSRGVHRSPDEPDLIDVGLRDCEARWMQRYFTRTISQKLGSKDWGEVTVNGEMRSVFVTIESFGVVEKMPQILEAIRAALANTRDEYEAGFMISLKAPKVKPTAAQKKLEKQFEEEQDEAYFEQRQRERQEYLERLHRYELKKQEGQKIDPKEFKAPAPEPPPDAPWEREEDEDSDEPGSGDVITKKKPEPPPSFLDDDDHPLADNYRMMGRLSLSEVWFVHRDPHLVTYLMGRAPDEVIPDAEQQ